jgi:hypothetical protein
MRQISKHNDDMDLRRVPSLVSHRIPTDTCQNDPDLAAVIQAWDCLPDAIRKNIVEMAKAASQAATLPAIRRSKHSEPPKTAWRASVECHVKNGEF